MEESTHFTFSNYSSDQEQWAAATIEIRDAEKRIAECERKIKIIEERFVVDKQRHNLKKEMYREHLLKGIKAIGIDDNCVYFDDTVVVFLDKVKVKKDCIILRIQSHLIKPIQNTFAIYSASTLGQKLSSHVSLYNKSGMNLGSPITIKYEQQPEPSDAIVELTYEDKVEIGEVGVLKLLIEKLVFSNEKEIKIEIPYDLKEIAPPKLPLAAVDSPATEVQRDFVKKIETISCKKVGNHLVVPVNLNIHGALVKAELLLDTGASATVISIDLYKKGNSKPLSELNKETFQTAKGELQYYIDNIEISTSAYSKTVAIAISEYNTPLLGANYFENNIFTVDVENECIYVHPKPK